MADMILLWPLAVLGLLQAMWSDYIDQYAYLLIYKWLTRLLQQRLH
jgi:hypothetical protein